MIENVARAIKSAILRYVANDIYAHDLDEDELAAIAKAALAAWNTRASDGGSDD